MKFFFIAALSFSVFAQDKVPDGSWGGGGQKKPPATQNSDGVVNLVKPLDEVWRVVFHNARGQDIVVDCEVARTEKDKERGLMFRKFLGKNRGMIFVYTKPAEMNFWMQNTHIPLSIAYIHEKLFVSSIHDMKPMSLDIIASETPVLYAVEVNQGWFKANSVMAGNRITIYKNPDEYKVEKKNKYRQLPAERPTAGRSVPKP